jgi:hypothetical protein
MKIKNNDSSVLILETGTNNDKCPRLEFRRKDSTISTSSIHMDSYGLVLSNSIESTTPGGGITFQTGGTNRGFYNAISRFQITKDGNFIPKTNKTYNIGSDGKKIKGLFVSDSIILGEVPFKTIKSTEGDLSIFIGSSVPKIDKSNAKSNIAIGDSALYNNTSGGQNNAFGSYALKKNTTGNNNNAFGYRSLYNNDTGDNNIAIGDSTLYNNTTGGQNNALGSNALYNNTTGNYNIAIGESALYNNESGDGNVAHGYQVGDTLTTGDSNVIIGSKADVSAASAKNQIVIGAGANGMGDSTVVLGDSLTIKTTYLHGDININRKYTIPKVDGNKGNVLRTDGEGTVSWDSTSIDDLHDVLLKDSSVFLGTEPQSINNARHNTAVGIKVFNNVTNGKNNTIMGFNAANTLTTGDSNLVIGYEADVDNGDALNRIVIGSRAIGFRDSTVVLGDSLTIQETFLHGNININREYIIPKSAGTSGQVLKYPSTGKTLEWGVVPDRINNLIDAKTEDSSIYLGTIPNNTISTSARPLRNTAVGIDSLKSVDSGIFNVANGYRSLYSNTKGSINVGIGNETLYNNTIGENNIAIGGRALYTNISGVENIAIGTTALYNNITGVDNIGIGTTALFLNNHGEKNIAIGHDALYNNIIGHHNVATGFHALNTNTMGHGNVAYGTYAMLYNTTGNQNVAFGHDALPYNTKGHGNVGIGYRSLYYNTKGHGNVGIGYRSLYYNNFNITDSIGFVLSSGNIDSLYTPVYSKYGNIGIGVRAIYNNKSGNNNIGIGTSTMDSTTTGSSNVAIGHGTMPNNTTGGHNTVIGFEAGTGLKTGDNNLIIGNHAHVDNADAQGQIVIGAGAKGMQDHSVVLGDSFTIQRTYLHGTVNIDRKYILPSTAGTSGQILKYPATGKTLEWADNIPNYSTITEKYLKVDNGNNLVWVNAQPTVTGTGAATINELQDAKVDSYSIYLGTVPQNLTTGHFANTSVGIDALNKITSGKKNTGLGYQALQNTKTGGWNIAIGNQALNKNLAGNDNTAIGNHALDQTLVSFNTAIGSSALENNTTGVGNVATGYRALSSNTTSGIELSSGTLDGVNTPTYSKYGNIAYGTRALYTNTTGQNNVAIGTSALDSTTTGSQNVAVGHGALQKNTTGNDNVATGYQALFMNITGNNNVASGWRALYDNISGTRNTASGYLALEKNTTGARNTVSGNEALTSNTTGSHNVASGSEALYSNTTGDGNVALGHKAGYSITVGDSNVIIGSEADISTGTGKNQIVIGPGAKGMGNNTVVLGNSLTIETTYLHGNIDINRAYILPKTAGTKGQVLKYPESGNTLEWDVGGGAGQSAGNVQIGDSSLYTSIANGPFEIFDGFYVADTQNNNIRKVTIDGVVSTLSLTKLDAAWKPKSLVYLDNNIYILNTNMARIEKLNISTNGLTQITQNNGLTNVIEITTDGTYLYALYNFLGTHYIYRIGLDGNSTTGIPPPWFPDPPNLTTGLSNPVGIIHINNNLYISESSTSKIKKLDIATKTLDDNFASLPSADSYGRNGGGLISIGTDIYYGCTQTYKIFKIPTTGSSAGTATALQQSSSDFSLTFAPYRLSHDGTNLYAWDNPTSSHQIFKIPINNDGTVGTVVSFVGSSSSGSANGTGSSAQFDKPHSMIPVIKNIIGKNNIAIGEKALYSNTIGTDNIALGHKAGDLIKTGNLNVIIGSDADVSNSTAINQIVIGAGAKGIGDNTVILGDSLTIQKTRLNGNIGINTSHPDRHLHVTSSESGKTVHIKCESSYADRNHIQLGATGTSYNRIYSRKMYGTTVKECKLLIETGDNDTGTGNIIMQFCPDFSGGTGHVGINVPKGIDPGVPLYVQGKNGVVSIKAEGTILGSQTTPSDRRIKENIHEINDNSALKKLRSIECYYYNYIDKEGRGYDSVVGFIAQEVKEYLPMAVNLIKDTIPNEMRKIENPQWTELSPKSFKLTIPDLEDVSANTKYKFNMRQDSSSPIKNAQSSTMEGDPKSFLFERKYNEVFLYGKEVNDFHTLAKDKLFALNFSASQELDRVQQQEKTKLQAAEAKIALLETENTQLKADIAAIKSHLGI